MAQIQSAFGNNPVGAASGDLSGSYPNPAVAKVNGVAVSGTAAIYDTLQASSSSAASWQQSLALQAATAVGGYALVNGTGTVITWTTPNDGALHRFIVCVSQVVTSPETGGVIAVFWTTPDGSTPALNIYNGGSGNGVTTPAHSYEFICKANTAVSVSQSGALTGGAATLWAEIWGS